MVDLVRKGQTRASAAHGTTLLENVWTLGHQLNYFGIKCCTSNVSPAPRFREGDGLLACHFRGRQGLDICRSLYMPASTLNLREVFRRQFLICGSFDQFPPVITGSKTKIAVGQERAYPLIINDPIVVTSQIIHILSHGTLTK